MIIYFFLLIITFVLLLTYAFNTDLIPNKITGNIIRIDEEAYGNINFDSTDLIFMPILDNNVDNNKNNVIHISFKVGGSKYNNQDNIVYHISLDDLVIDCNLISPYLKWKLLKNKVLISQGSLDYKFDTIEDGRLILTSIQQDLKKYSEDKTTYDDYDFYLWLSDSCQSDNIMECLNAEEKSHLLNKKISGKIQVELSAADKQELIRKPSDILNSKSCVVESGDEIYVNR